MIKNDHSGNINKNVFINRGAPRVFTTILLCVSLIFCIAGKCAAAGAAPDAVLRASGDTPSSKTAKTIKDEKELEKLTAKEKQLKEQITAATINRSKILAQKRAELKLIRQARDDAINRDITSIKARKAKQAELVRVLKNQLAAEKKGKNKIAIAAAEASVKAAEKKLADINNELKIANDRLTKSYKDYKAVYDNLTRLDEEIKKVLDINIETEKKVKGQKTDFSNTKSEYNQSVRNKDFLTAERRMASLVFIQGGINESYEKILDIKLKVKSDYTALIINYKF